MRERIGISVGRGQSYVGIENERPRAASVGLMGMSVQLLLAGRERCSAGFRRSVHSTFADLPVSWVLG